jgi:hypothetical protein
VPSTADHQQLCRFRQSQQRAHRAVPQHEAVDVDVGELLLPPGAAFFAADSAAASTASPFSSNASRTLFFASRKSG